MKLHEYKSAEGARHRRKRLGRGMSSGFGKTSGKGHKGQNDRTGKGTRVGFEGGQTPLFQRLPKRGFTNVNRKEYAVVDIRTLYRDDEGTETTPEQLLETGVVSKFHSLIKVLGKGSPDKKLTIIANQYSPSAVEAIEKAGGITEVI